MNVINRTLSHRQYNHLILLRVSDNTETIQIIILQIGIVQEYYVFQVVVGIF